MVLGADANSRASSLFQDFENCQCSPFLFCVAWIVSKWYYCVGGNKFHMLRGQIVFKKEKLAVAWIALINAFLLMLMITQSFWVIVQNFRFLSLLRLLENRCCLHWWWIWTVYMFLYHLSENLVTVLPTEPMTQSLSDPLHICIMQLFLYHSLFCLLQKWLYINVCLKCGMKMERFDFCFLNFISACLVSVCL